MYGEEILKLGLLGQYLAVSELKKESDKYLYYCYTEDNCSSYIYKNISSSRSNDEGIPYGRVVHKL